jgi:hypothetical protein
VHPGPVRKADRIEHPLEEMLRLRMFAITAGYEDANDCNSLRYDPIFKTAVGHAPESGDALCSQPTLSRLESAPSKIEIARPRRGDGVVRGNPRR